MGLLGQNTYPPGEPESLYERFPWLYSFCRDHLFRDDTMKIVAALWPSGIPRSGSNLLEIGCGPGFYARRLAEYSQRLTVTGIDRSARQLRSARTLAASQRLDNCTFEEDDARAITRPDNSVDAVVVSRLFIILLERKQVISEIHRVLRPGGRCFIAEPRSALRAAVPLRALRLLASAENLYDGGSRDYREPIAVSVLNSSEFGSLVYSQPWNSVQRWQDIWYQYAVCEKPLS